MARRRGIPKPIKHPTKWDRMAVGEFTLVSKVKSRRFEVPLSEHEHMDSCNLYKKIALHYNVKEENIILEPGYYMVKNVDEPNPYYGVVDPEDDGYEYNARGNLVKISGHKKWGKNGKDKK
tara:strand:+ start:4574 stop:4936 length:363 start_codon:yes stop_codon:yes gene_type:complete